MESLTSYIWPRSMSLSPIHVCQQNSSRTATIIKWALTPFSGLHDVPVEISKREDKTIVKIETQQGRILDGVQDEQGHRGECEDVFGTKNVISYPSMSFMMNVHSDSVG